MGSNGAESVKAAALGHNKGNLAKGLERILKIDIAVQKLKADRMNVFNDLDDQGFDRKEVGAIIKIKTKPLTLEFKRGVNDMLAILGLKPEYNLTAEELAQLEAGDTGEHDEDKDEE